MKAKSPKQIKQDESEAAAAQCDPDYSVLIIPSDHSPLIGGGRGYRIDTIQMLTNNAKEVQAKNRYRHLVKSERKMFALKSCNVLKSCQ